METKPINTGLFQHLYPFSSHYLSINGLQYHYLDEGQGHPLVMVHGNPTWSFFFRHIVTALRNDYRTIVPDHIGCGLSDKPPADAYDYRLRSRVNDVSTLLNHTIPTGPLTLMVHDWGGMIGLAWAMDNIERLSRIVIMNTAGFFPPGSRSIPIRLRLLRTPNPLMDRMVLHFNLFAKAALFMAGNRRLSKEVKAGLIAPYNCPQNRLATLKFVQDIPLSEKDPSGNIVAKVQKNLFHLKQIPVLLLWGGRDFVFTRPYYDEWQRRLPHAECHWLPDTGHYLLEDKPDLTVDLVKRFLHNHPIQ